MNVHFSPSTIWVVLASSLACSACTHAPGALDRVRAPGETRALEELYSQYQVPLVLIGQSVYVPSCACLDNPCQRERGGAMQARAHGGADETRAHGGGDEARARGGADEARAQGGADEARAHGGADEARQGGAAVEQRQLGAGAEERQSGAKSESRDVGATSEAREMGGASTTVSCVKTGSHQFRVMAAANQPVQFFDGRHVAEAPGRRVSY